MKIGVLGLGLIAPLVLAVFLAPNPTGHGTHRQLGLPPCSAIVLFGCRCPSCGMTTAFSHTVRGQIVGAIRANSAGAALALFDVLVAPWLVVSAVWGWWWPCRPNPNVLAWITSGILGLMMIDWGLRLWLGL